LLNNSELGVGSVPSFDEIYHHLILGIFYDIVKHWLTYAVGVGAIHLILKFVFEKIKTNREVIVLWCGLFILFSVSGSVLGARQQEPNLLPGIQSVVTGGINSDKDTVAVLEMTIMNIGSMQSIAKNWSIEATINGTKYSGLLSSMADTFTFNLLDRTKPDAPHDALTYHKEDQIMSKGMTPTQPGGITPGILFVIFEGIEPGIFKGGAEFTVTFEDVFSKKYAAAIRSNAKRPERITTTPGLHTDMMCPVPSGALPKVN
jgi:hypothetical protein